MRAYAQSEASKTAGASASGVLSRGLVEPACRIT